GLMAFRIAVIPEFNRLDTASGESCRCSRLILHKQWKEQGTYALAEWFIEKCDFSSQPIFHDSEIAPPLFPDPVVFEATEEPARNPRHGDVHGGNIEAGISNRHATHSCARAGTADPTLRGHQRAADSFVTASAPA